MNRFHANYAMSIENFDGSEVDDEFYETQQSVTGKIMY